MRRKKGGVNIKLIKNKNIQSKMILSLRALLMKDERKTRKLLGVDSNNMVESLPIRNRDFELWVVISDIDELVGFVSFVIDEKELFIKELYIGPTFRRNGYGRQVYAELLKEFSKISCRINQGNQLMYKFAHSVGLRGEKGSPLFSNSRLKPVWWSNYKSEDKYIK